MQNNSQLEHHSPQPDDTGTRSALCPVPRVRGGKPQGSSSPIKICDLMAPDWWAPQAPTTSVEE
ncbi:MAG: hypothetical protein QNJ51_06525, partial [Calothrix sp. MO_167.B12]|nr:hypothetical protein [Calothrix sp. MO_167.B12]